MLDPNNQVIYVSGDGSGDFNVIESMKYSAQTIINKAINYVKNHPTFKTVYLKGPFTYWINGTINCCSNLELTGDATACVKLVNTAGWKKMVPLIGPYNEKLTNISIHDFEIDGNHDGNFKPDVGKAQVFPYVNKGAGYYNLMYFTYSSNIFVYNMYLHDGHGDGLRVANCTNVRFYKNTVNKLGHDAAFFLRSYDCHSYENIVSIRTNSGTRMNDCNNSSIHDNRVWAYANYWDAGNPGFQIERQYKNEISVDIYNNEIHDTYGCGIWVVCNELAVKESGKSKVYIHHNKIYGCGINPNIYYVGGVINFGIHNVIVENNVIDECYGHGVACMGVVDSAVSETPVAMYVRNNIIMNTRQRKYSPVGTGHGIHNRVASTHKMYVNNNCVWNNFNGNYSNVTPFNDINVDPLCVNDAQRDYHLESTVGRWDGHQWVKDLAQSPCIDKGDPISIYDAEPDPNGGRINIGLYGGTRFASKSVVDIAVEEPDKVEVEEHVVEEPIVEEPVETPVGKPVEEVPVKVKQITSILYPVFNNRLKQATPDVPLKTYTYSDVGALGGSVYRCLEYFDLSEFDNKVIDKAELKLYWYFPENKTRANDTIVEVYRPDTYTAIYATWNNKNKTQKWEVPGGVWYDSKGTKQGRVPYADIKFSKGKVPTDSYYSLDVTELVQQYATGVYPNTGFMLRAKDENNNYIAFYSGNIQMTNKKLTLVVTYHE